MKFISFVGCWYECNELEDIAQVFIIHVVEFSEYFLSYFIVSHSLLRNKKRFDSKKVDSTEKIRVSKNFKMKIQR